MRAKVKTLIKQIEEGRLDSDRAKILSHIMKHPYSTIIDLCNKLNMKIQTVSGRLSELMDLGIVEEKGQKETSTSVYTYLKYQANTDKQEDNARQRLSQKYEIWINQGLNKFDTIINPFLKHELNESRKNLPTG